VNMTTPSELWSGGAAMAGLTTHVLDTAQGIPAAGVKIRLVKVNPAPETLLSLTETVTNQGGRASLLSAAEMSMGVYELWFDVGEYFAQQGIPLASPPFLSEIPIRFAIGDPQAHYHIPLLVSPWAYSTYRGS